MQDAALEQMFDARKALSALIADTSPATPADQAQYAQLVGTRDRLTQAINGVIGAGFTASAADLQTAITQLTGCVAQLEASGDTRDAVATGIDIGGQVLKAVATIVAFAV
jgi:DNA-binding GntR family transcriptional regulator